MAIDEASVSFCYAAGAGSDLGNGGGATLAAWEAKNAYTDFMAADGGPIASETACTLSGGADLFITATSSGAFSDVVVGTIALCMFTGVYANGYYIITDVDPSGDWVEINLTSQEVPTPTGETCDIVIGGAIDGLENVINTDLANATNYDSTVLIKGSETLGGQQDINTGGGSSTTRLRFIGVNSSWEEDGTRAVITTSSSITSLVKITDVDYFEFRHIDFDGNSNATYCFTTAAITDAWNTAWVDCLFHGAVSDGIYTPSYYQDFIDCEIYSNGQDGIGNNGNAYYWHVVNCKIHDNNRHGVYGKFGYALFAGTSFYNNGQGAVDGSGFAALSPTATYTFISNVFYNNYADGFEAAAGALGWTLLNNTSVDNGGYGFNFASTSEGAINFFAYNHASGNSSGHYQIGTSNPTDASFVNFKQGNNINGTQSASQLFVDADNGDFTPKTGSELIDAGLDVGNGTQDIGAVQQEAGAGAGGGGTQILGGFIVR